MGKFGQVPYVLRAAYGRRYTTAAEAIADWEAGKDFQIARGPSYVGAYTSKRDEAALGEVWLRYNTPVHGGEFSPEIVQVR